MKELMLHVESIVRPLDITQYQCDRFREEMLGHLESLYAEEFSLVADHEASVARAIERFGSVETVREDLQQSLPWYTTFLAAVPWFTRVRSWPERPSRIAWRGWMTGIWFWCLIGLPWCVVRVASGDIGLWQASLLWILMAGFGTAILIPFVGMAGSLYGAYGYSKSKGRAIVFLLLGMASQMVILAIIKGFTNPELHVGVFGIPFAFGLALFGMLNMSDVRRSIEDDIERDRRTGEWELLSLDG